MSCDKTLIMIEQFKEIIMYKTSEDILENLRSEKTSIASVNRQMHRYFKKKDINKWLLFAKAKTLYLMEKEDDPEK